MGRKPKATDYVSNNRLRELIIEYNDTNPNDTGDWLDKFEKTMKTKGKLATVAPWIALRREKYSQPRKPTPHFEKVSNELFKAIYKIAQGRIACFSGIPVDEREDLLQDCMLAVTQYINRYREDIETSAFAYTTQIINNAIKLHMGQDNDSRWCRQPWSEITDQCASLLYGYNDEDEPYNE
jgi:DNA-directed RNA polymerase specialized sigma24 family protein